MKALPQAPPPTGRMHVEQPVGCCWNRRSDAVEYAEAEARGGPAGLRRRRHGRRHRGGGRLPPPRPRVPRYAQRAPRPRAAPGDGRDRSLPHRCARRACPPLRRLRPHRDRLQFLPQSSLPKCQGRAREAWVAARRAELLPVPYFHVVFTLPAPVGAIAFQNKAAVYAILFRAAAETLRVIAADPRHLGAEIGGVAVLHSWGQARRRTP